jgi:PAS domain S-box-containing protein
MQREDGASAIHELEELRRQNDALKAENARLRSAFKAAPSKPGEAQPSTVEREDLILESATGYAIFTTDQDGILTSWNEGARLIHGWNKEEVLGRHARLIFTPEDREAGAPEEEMRLAASRGSAEDERWHMRKDGARFFATGLLMPLRDGSGGFVKILRDRTDQLHAERNQLRRLQQMKALAEAARAIMGAADLATTLDAITVAARDIIGAHQAICSTTRGPDWSQAVTAVSLSDKYAAWRSYDKAPDGSGVYAWICEGNRTIRMTQAELEAHPRWRGFGKHAKEHPAMRGWLATALVGGDGKNLGLIQLSDKIEGEFDEVDEAILVQLAQFAASAIERSQAGDELRANAEFTDRILESSSDCIKVLDLDGRLQFMSAGGQAVMEIDDFELFKGCPWPEFWSGSDRDAAAAAIEAARAGGVGRFQGFAPTAKGTPRWWDVVVTPINGSDGRPDRLLSVSRDQTKERLAQEAVRGSEARLRNVFAIQTVGVVFWSREYRLTEVNDAFLSMTGFSRGEALGKTWQELTPEEFHPASWQAVSEVAARGESTPFEKQYFRKDGSRWWGLFAARKIGDEVVEFVLNISGRKQTETELRKSEARFRAAVEAVEGVLWTNNARGEMVGEQPGWAALTGQTCEEYQGLGWAKAVHPDDAQASIDAWNEAVRERKTFVLEHRVRRRDGEWRRFSIRAIPAFDANGEIREWVGVHTDITELRARENELRDLNATLEQRVTQAIAERDRTWNNSQDLLLVLDMQGVLRATNPAWSTILGWMPDELSGRGYLDLTHPDDHDISRKALAAASQGPLPSFEIRLLHRDGSLRRIAWVAAPEGGLIYASGRDVTEERRKEEALTAAQDALRQAQKMEAIGQLTGGVAHDFNNLLTIIRSSVDFLRRRELPEERRLRYVDAIADTVERASKLTRQLLAFARRQALKPEVFDIADRIRSITDMLRTIVGSRIEIVTEIECERCHVEADVSQFETALVNMAVNARDAMDGEGVLTLRIEGLGHMPPIRGHGGGAGAFAAVSIADTGAGISPDQLPHIFEPFFTTKEVGKGTGLGLSQVYGFAKQSGGDVAVASEVGRGTTFVLYLPRVEAEPDEEDSGALYGSGPAEHGRGRRVLVVEDNIEVGRFSTQTLQDLGYETTWAANGDEALELLEKTGAGFDVVFSDVVMPGIGGVELGQEIRRRYPGLPVVLTSGYSHVLAEEGRHGFELLHKPYAADELSRVLRRVAQRRRRPGR